MAFKMNANMMPDDGVDWGQFFLIGNCPRTFAQRVAMRNTDIKSFFICRTDMQTKIRAFRAGEAVFVMKKVALKQNKSCDTFEKDFFNVAYLSPRNVPLRYAGSLCLADDRRPFFDMVCLFAAGMHGAVDDVRLSIGGGLENALARTDDVAALQSLGITVLLSVVGDWGPAGWNCFPSERSAAIFATLLFETVQKYGLDGVDIDDEYSKGATNSESLIMVTSHLREHSSSLVISKALQPSDQKYFARDWKGKTLAQQLTYGWDMMYGNVSGLMRLKPYSEALPEPRMRMQKEKLALGVWNCPPEVKNGNATPPEAVMPQTEQVKVGGYGGMMIFGVEDVCNAPDFETRVGRIFYGQQVESGTGSWELPTGILALAHSVKTGGDDLLNVSFADTGRAFGRPVPVRAPNSYAQDGTDIGSAMAVFQDRIWLAWIGPKKDNKYNYLNICPATFDVPTEVLKFGDKKMFENYRSLFAPALAVFKDRLYVAWTDLQGKLQLMSGDGKGTWSEPRAIVDGVLGVAALSVIGGRLCAIAITDPWIIALRSTDGTNFEKPNIIKTQTPHDLAAAAYQDWIYLACLVKYVEPTERVAIRVLRSQDGAVFVGFGNDVPVPSPTCSGVRIAGQGPDLHLVAKDDSGAVYMWTRSFKGGEDPFGKGVLLPAIQSVAAPSLVWPAFIPR